MGVNDCGSTLGPNAGCVIYPIATLWTFFGMSFVAEEYFSVALDGLVARYKIPDAVAGATVLAVGTSFPELIIGFVSQFLSGTPEPSINLGVTCGSAIFNQLAIVSASTLAAKGGVLKLSWQAMLRDVLLWIATIALSAGLLADGEIDALDGWLLVALYAVYVLLCGFWGRIDKFFASCSLKPPSRVMRMVLPYKPRHHESAIYFPPYRHHRHLGDGAEPKRLEEDEEEGKVEERADKDKDTSDSLKEEASKSPAEAHAATLKVVEASRPPEENEEEHHFDKDHGPLNGPFPPDFPNRIRWICQSPFSIFCYYVQLPFLRRRKMHGTLALVGGVILAVIAYFMSQWLESSACILGVPNITLSLLFAAPGTSLPEMMVATGVARKGLGTSAVSTSLGSNIFDILIALGLPWAIYATAVEPIYVDSALVLTCVMAASTGFFILVALASRWMLRRAIGVVMLGLYGAFILYVILEAIPGINISGLSSSI